MKCFWCSYQKQGEKGKSSSPAVWKVLTFFKLLSYPTAYFLSVFEQQKDVLHVGDLQTATHEHKLNETRMLTPCFMHVTSFLTY